MKSVVGLYWYVFINKLDLLLRNLEKRSHILGKILISEMYSGILVRLLRSRNEELCALYGKSIKLCTQLPQVIGFIFRCGAISDLTLIDLHSLFYMPNKKFLYYFLHLCSKLLYRIPN